jgi:hypothetical protein
MDKNGGGLYMHAIADEKGGYIDKNRWFVIASQFLLRPICSINYTLARQHSLPVVLHRWRLKAQGAPLIGVRSYKKRNAKTSRGEDRPKQRS